MRFLSKRTALICELEKLSKLKQGVQSAVELIDKLIADSDGTPATPFLVLKREEAQAELNQLSVDVTAMVGRVHQVDEFIREDAESDLDEKITNCNHRIEAALGAQI